MGTSELLLNGDPVWAIIALLLIPLGWLFRLELSRRAAGAPETPVEQE